MLLISKFDIIIYQFYRSIKLYIHINTLSQSNLMRLNYLKNIKKIPLLPIPPSDIVRKFKTFTDLKKYLRENNNKLGNK